jgi:DNA-binding LytR/AlgR family response regulator
MIRCLAIDDEKLALDLISDNIRKVPFLKLEATCSNAMEAIEIMNQVPVDLIFLDIRMPGISGIQFLKTLISKPAVILTTAYSTYALEGFELDVVDYLLKPYSFERFLRAVQKAQDFLAGREREEPVSLMSAGTEQQDYIFVKSEYRLVRVDLDQVLYIEGLKDYVKIFLEDRLILTQMSMKMLEERLPAPRFLRVHRSYMVAVARIDTLQKHAITIGKREIPLGEQYRDKLFQLIQPENNT